MKADGIDITYVVEENVIIPAFDGEQKFEYARENVKKEEEQK